MSSTNEASAKKYKKAMGTYIAKRVKKEKFEIGSEEYQRFYWDENNRKITGFINRANTTNITFIDKVI